MADKKGAHADEGGGHFLGLTIEILIGIGLILFVVFGLSAPFDPTYINLEYIFAHMLDALRAVVTYFVTYNVGNTIVFVVGIICIFLIGLCFYLFLRLLEMEQEHEDHVYHYAHDDEYGHEAPRSLLHEVLHDVGELASDTGGLVHNTTAKAVGATVGTFDKILFRDEADLLSTQTKKPAHFDSDKEGTYKWRMVVKHIASRNPSDWKIAIIEADTILDVLVDRSGFPGATLGERLKNADPGVFRTLSFAKEAHAVRNKIAHEGSSFTLSERDAKRAIQQYEEVFREFNYI